MHTMSYDSNGNLSRITDSSGREIALLYDASNRINSVVLPDGASIFYTYDSSGNLSKVTYPGGSVRSYFYDESGLVGQGAQSNLLTGIQDESGNRYATYTYDSQSRGISSSHADGAGIIKLSYQSNGVVLLTDALHASRTYTISTGLDISHIASVAGGCAGCDLFASYNYNSTGDLIGTNDFKGNATTYKVDAIHLEVQRIDGAGSPQQRTTNFTWNTTLRVPLTRVVLDAGGTTVGATQWVYNSAGQTLARCEIDPTNSAAAGYACSTSGTVPAGVRRWTYTYCTDVDGTQCPLVGLLLTATGPRTDVAQTTSYSYYMDSATSGCPTPGGTCHQPGDLHTVTDPAGHVTTIASYDADGRVTRETDANSINTDLTYTPRGWLASRTVGGAQTTIGYTPYGAVSSVTDPDGVATTYTYDAAHRLTQVTDAQGNTVQYTLDAAGNKTAEQVVDSSGTAHQSLSRTFNPLGELTTVVDGLNHTVFDASASGSYDANGNLVHSSDGLGIQRQSSYDALNRLVRTIDNYNGTN